MSMMWKGVPIPVLISLLLLVLGGLLHIVGLATPYWHSVSRTNALVRDDVFAHHGLWAACSSEIMDIVDCSSHSDVEGYIVGVRALEVLALLCGAICIIVTGIWFFLQITKHRLLMMISALGSGFVAGLFGLVGIIVYAAEINSRDRESIIPGEVYNYTLDWSFALCTLSSCLVVIATGLIALGTRMMDR
ncbi:hypothetical protein ACF0H5_011981 [Mactra antiquata]